LLVNSAWPVHQRDTECQRLLTELSRQPFDLSQDMLLRATLLRLGAQDHVLLLVTHDIASDGWSGSILFHELSALYHTLVIGATPALPALPVQYADFAAWQSEWLQEGGLDTQLTYWKEHLQGVPPLLQLSICRVVGAPAGGVLRGIRPSGSAIREARRDGAA
jgi:hypothetical protein